MLVEERLHFPRILVVESFFFPWKMNSFYCPFILLTVVVYQGQGERVYGQSPDQLSALASSPVSVQANYLSQQQNVTAISEQPQPVDETVRRRHRMWTWHIFRKQVSISTTRTMTLISLEIRQKLPLTSSGKHPG